MAPTSAATATAAAAMATAPSTTSASKTAAPRMTAAARLTTPASNTAALMTAAHKSANRTSQAASQRAPKMVSKMASRGRAMSVASLPLPVARTGAAPTVPAVSAAPAYAFIPSVPAPIPSRALPSVVIPAIILAIEDELRFLDNGTLDKRDADADRRFGGVCNRQGDARQECN